MSRSYPIDPETRIPAAEGTEKAAWAALRTVEDPELPISVVDLGLIYDVSTKNRTAEIDLTLTYSGCPAKELIIRDIKHAVGEVDNIDSVSVSVVHSPPWSYDRITDTGRENLKEHGMAVPDESQDIDADCY